jgi:hypothetical protein
MKWCVFMSFQFFLLRRVLKKNTANTPITYSSHMKWSLHVMNPPRNECVDGIFILFYFSFFQNKETQILTLFFICILTDSNSHLPNKKKKFLSNMTGLFGKGRGREGGLVVGVRIDRCDKK